LIRLLARRFARIKLPAAWAALTADAKARFVFEEFIK